MFVVVLRCRFVFVDMVVSPSQKREEFVGKKPIDVAETEVSDVGVFALYLSISDVYLLSFSS